MTTQRSLSAAAPASQGQICLAPRFGRGPQWHRHSCLCAVAKPSTQPTEATTSLPSEFLIANDNPTRIVILSDQRESKGHSSLSLLIANPELEFHLSLIRISDLKIPNRKFLTIFDTCSALNFCFLASSHSPLATALLIHGSAIKTPRNTFRRNTYEFLIGGKRGSQAPPAAQPQPPNLAPIPRVCYFPSRTPLE